MNIGIVTTWFERGAAYVSRQYKELLSSEFSVFVYARGGESYAIGDKNWDFPEVTWGKKSKYNLLTIVDKRDFTKWLLDKKIDICFFNEQHCFLPPLLCKKMGIITACYVDYYKASTIPLFDVYDFVICNTKRHFSAFQKHPSAYYIPWGTDIDLFRPSEDKKLADSICFFHSCGMSPDRKGTDSVIRAFFNIRHDHSKLLIHSQVTLSSFLSDEVNKMLQELCKSGDAEIVEMTIPAPGLYQKGDVYVYPTHLEGIGLSVPEAISSGLQIIVPDEAPMNEFIDQDGRNGKSVKIYRRYSRDDGYYWSLCDVDLFDLQKIMQHYNDHYNEAIQWKQNARKYAETYLSWSDRRNVLVDIFKRAQKNTNFNLIEKRIMEYEKKNNGIEAELWMNDASSFRFFFHRLFRYLGRNF